jgi:GNAT superfamily N-acetyltransferase
LDGPKKGNTVIEINLSESGAAVRSLFTEAVPDGPRLFSALNGFHPAIALVDSVDCPSWCVLRSSWFGRTFIGGEIKPDVLGLAIQRLCKTGRVLLDLGDHRSASFPPGATEVEPRIEFYDRSPGDGSVACLIASVPVGLSVRPVAQETFDSCAWQDPLRSIFGTASGYLERSIGFLLLDGRRILSEAHAFFWGDTVVEIGVITAEGHRGLGYASIVSAYLVRACESRGYATYWGCHVDNLASAAVARKLGYRIENKYSLAWYPAASRRV